MGKKIKIRQYRPRDREAVWHLHNLALEETRAHLGNGPWDDDLKRSKEQYIDSGGDFLVGEIEGTLVAMGALRKTDALRVQLKRMRIHPEYQRRGLGKLMVCALEERAVALGFRFIHLDTTTIQKEKMGFAVELFLDEPGAKVIRDLFERTRSSLAVNGASPHISLAVFNDVDTIKSIHHHRPEGRFSVSSAHVVEFRPVVTLASIALAGTLAEP